MTPKDYIYISVVDCLPAIHEALGSVPSTEKKKWQQKIEII